MQQTEQIQHRHRHLRKFIAAVKIITIKSVRHQQNNKYIKIQSYMLQKLWMQIKGKKQNERNENKNNSQRIKYF